MARIARADDLAAWGRYSQARRESLRRGPGRTLPPSMIELELLEGVYAVPPEKLPSSLERYVAISRMTWFASLLVVSIVNFVTSDRFEQEIRTVLTWVWIAWLVGWLALKVRERCNSSST